MMVSLNGWFFRRPLLAGFSLFTLVGVVVFSLADPRASSSQPIAFKHAKHVEAGMACPDCHPGAQDEVKATLPPLSTCLSCHEAEVTSSPEEAKIRTLAAAGKELQWSQLTILPPDVYFSHRRHVRLAGLDCAGCHGPMEKATAPPPRAYMPVSMERCLDCHEQRKVRNECTDCHR